MKVKNEIRIRCPLCRKGFLNLKSGGLVRKEKYFCDSCWMPVDSLDLLKGQNKHKGGVGNGSNFK